MAQEDEEIAEELISDIVKAIGKHSRELGDLADRLATKWNEFTTGCEAHRAKWPNFSPRISLDSCAMGWG